MNTKIIFFDIDGTILSHRTYQISDSTKTAIRKARENGHLLFVNTGRSYAEIDNQVKSLGFDGFVCGCGTYIRYHDDDLQRTPLSADDSKRIVDDLRTNNIEAVLEGTDSVYFNYASTFSRMNQQREYFTNILHLNVKSWDDTDITFDKFSVWNNAPETVNKFLKKYQDRFDYINHGSNFVEIVPKGYSKASGIEFLINHLNIPHENTYALGDSSNDLQMLNYVKHSIGMGNSEDEIAKIVSFLTKDVDQGGVAHALEYYNII